MNWETRCDIRELRGRPRFRTMTRQYDHSQRSLMAATVAPDPILDLYVARSNWRSSSATAQRYGEIRQRVVSPVCLP